MDRATTFPDTQALRRAYGERLPELVADLAGAWQAVCRGGMTEAQCEDLAKQAAVLAGSAATFGCQEVADVARRFEELLRRAGRVGWAGTALFVRQGDAYVEWLAAASR